MNNGEAPTGFQPAPFPQQLGPDGHTIVPPKKKGGRRGPRTAAPKAKNGRRKKKQGSPNIAALSKVTRQHLGLQTKAPRTVKVDLAFVVSVMSGLSETEAATVAAMTQSLQLVPKKSRGRILAALAKMGAA